MNRTIRIIAVLLLSGMLAVAMALLSWDRSDSTVERTERSNRNVTDAVLTESNLVDYLIRLPLKLEIRKVNWKSNILSIDLSVLPHTTTQDAVYHDFYELAQFAMGRMPNVEQLQVRMIAATSNLRGSAGQLVSAMDARRSMYHAYASNKEDKTTDNINIKQYLHERCHFTYTQKWKDLLVYERNSQ